MAARRGTIIRALRDLTQAIEAWSGGGACLGCEGPTDAELHCVDTDCVVHRARIVLTLAVD